MDKIYFYEVDVWNSGSSMDKFYVLAPSFVSAAKFIESTKLYTKRKVCMLSRSSKNISWNDTVTIYKVDKEGNLVEPKKLEEYKEENFE